MQGLGRCLKVTLQMYGAHNSQPSLCGDKRHKQSCADGEWEPPSKIVYQYYFLVGPNDINDINKELKDFENDLVKLSQNLKFRKRSNPFLTTLKREINKISDQKKLIVSADKTTNKYLVPLDEYMKILDKEIQKNYKKESPQNVKKTQMMNMQKMLRI